MTAGDKVVFIGDAGNGVVRGTLGVAINGAQAIPYLEASDMAYWSQYMAQGIFFGSRQWKVREVNIG